MLSSRNFDLRRQGIGLRSVTRALMPVLLAFSASSVQSQTIDDGIMMPKNACARASPTRTRVGTSTGKGRSSGATGTSARVTTETVAWGGNYGVTDRLNVIAMVPYVWTNASQGVLHGMSGFQDVTLAAKYNLLETPFTSHGSLRTILVASAGAPLTDYTPDFYPLSIGSASKRFSGRMTLDVPRQARVVRPGLGRLHLAGQGDASTGPPISRTASST